MAQYYHSADSTQDYAINLTELLRVIQFYNIRGFHCETGTEDGYAPGPGPEECTAHDSDYAPQDWQFDLSELLRLIQFFNIRGYHTQCDSEDTFAPGAGLHYSCEGEEEGVIEGQLEGVEEGQPEGLIEGEGIPEGEGQIEGVIEGQPEGVVEGQSEGVVEGTPEGVVEGQPEGIVEGEGQPEGVTEGEGTAEGEGQPEGEGTAEGEGQPEGVIEGQPEGVVEGGGEGSPEGVVEGEGEGQPEGQPEGVVEGEGEGVAEGEGEGVVEGEGEGSPEGEGEGEGSPADVTLSATASPPAGGFVVPSGGTYAVNTSVMMVAIANTGWRFHHWSGDLSGSVNPTSILMNTSKNVTAVFVQQFVLTTAVTGFGSVVPSGGTYDANEVVELTANPGAGWRFDHWSGDLTGSTNPDSVTMNAAKSVTAVFIEQFALTTNVIGSGAIAPSGGLYDAGASVELTATPDTGWHFAYWAGALTGSANPASVTMDSAKSVTATFVINQFTLTYLAGDHGSISGSTPQTVNYGASGTAVLAVADLNYHFVQWSDTSTQNPRTDTNVTANLTLTATFAIDQYTLTYTAGEHGSISGTSPQTVDHGGSGTAVLAVADSGYHFVQWSDASTPNPRTDTNVMANIGVTAEFESNTETILLPGDVPLDMVWIPVGSFQMGRTPGEQDSFDSEDPRHTVTYATGFWMGKYELTQAQWVAVMGSNPSYFKPPTYSDDPGRPVEQVSWNNVQAFIATINTVTGRTFRLPTEAEWEYACRADTATRFYWGDDSTYSQIGAYAWYSGNSSSTTHAVGGKTPNAWGLCDMTGNVWEWCEDDWHDNYMGAPANGTAWVDSPRGSSRLVRGGSYVFDGGYCRSSRRFTGGPSGAGNSIGFRLAR
jgi:formylglycine-generating enzyme required for sulfatase activity